MQFMSDSIILNHYVRARQGKENIVILFVYFFQHLCLCSVRLGRSFRRVTSTGALENQCLDMHARTCPCVSRARVWTTFFRLQNLQDQIFYSYVRIAKHIHYYSLENKSVRHKSAPMRADDLPLCYHHHHTVAAMNANKLFILNKEINLHVQFVFISFRFFFLLHRIFVDFSNKSFSLSFISMAGRLLQCAIRRLRLYEF